MSPNPASSVVRIEGINKGSRINIIASTGAVMARYTSDDQFYQINIGSLPAGIYTVEIIDTVNAQVYHLPLLKK
jgi:hypothetical protein